MVRRWANDGVDRHDRNHSSRPQRAHVRTRECDPRGLRKGGRLRLRRGLRQAGRRAAGGDRSLSLGSIPRRLSRLSLDEEAANRPRDRRDPLSAVYARRERSAGGVGGQSRRGGTLETRWDRRDDARHRTAVGLAERMGAVAVYRSRRANQLWAEPPRRDDRLPLDGQRLAGLSLNRQTGGEIRRDRDQPTGRGRRISNAGRLWLDQWGDAEAYGALSGRRRSDERRPLSRARGRVNSGAVVIARSPKGDVAIQGHRRHSSSSGSPRSCLARARDDGGARQAAAHDAAGACAALKRARSAARLTLRAFTMASRPRAGT